MSSVYDDLYRYTGTNKKVDLFKLLLTNPGFTYIFFFRKCQNSRYKILKLFFKIILRILMIFYQFQIPVDTLIGPGFYIGHFGSIVINPKAILGKNINIANGVTIGQENRGKRKGTPVIGDEVWIGTNSVIVGNIKIGNNVLIAPNSYVNFDVPDNSIVIGNPGKIKPNLEATKDYINNKV